MDFSKSGRNKDCHNGSIEIGVLYNIRWTNI